MNVAISWSSWIRSFRFRGIKSGSSKSFCNADKIMMELLISEQIARVLGCASLSIDMTGPRISTTFPAAAKIPTIDAATLRGSMRMLNEERSYKKGFF